MDIYLSASATDHVEALFACYRSNNHSAHGTPPYDEVNTDSVHGRGKHDHKEGIATRAVFG